MADPPAVALAGAAVSGQDALLATKLHVPRPPPGRVEAPDDAQRHAFAR